MCRFYYVVFHHSVLFIDIYTIAYLTILVIVTSHPHMSPHVTTCRHMLRQFWTRFSQGKGFAQRQTKWDALFMGISAMGRDESFVNYLLR